MIEKIDMLILEFIQQNLQSSFLDWIMNFLSFLGEMAWIWFLITAVYAAVNKKKNAVLILAFALLLNHFICSGILKNLIKRSRPFISNTDLITHAWKFPSGYSFPSGHSSSSFCAAAVLTAAGSSKKIIWYLLAGGIAFSRIYLNVHYPSDIFCGAIFGTLIGYSIWRFMNWYNMRTVNKN